MNVAEEKKRIEYFERGFRAGRVDALKEVLRLVKAERRGWLRAMYGEQALDALRVVVAALRKLEGKGK